jgi:hypothetical protein
MRALLPLDHGMRVDQVMRVGADATRLHPVAGAVPDH